MDENQKKIINWKPYIIDTIISIIIGAFILILMFVIIKRPLSDGFSFAALALISIGVFMWLGREGFFDIFVYGFKQFGSIHFTKKPLEYNDYPGYKEHKTEIRSKRSKNFLPFMIVGAAFLIASIIMFIVSRA